MDQSPQKTAEASKAKKRVRWVLLIIVAFVCVSIGVVMFLGISLDRAMMRPVREADAGFAKAKKTIDPEELRSWALKVLSQYPATNQWGSVHILPASVPNYVQSLYAEPPEEVCVQKEGEQSCMQIIWGGGFFHWQIDIGSTNYSEKVGIEDTYTTAEWVPGIYYSREDTRHPIQ